MVLATEKMVKFKQNITQMLLASYDVYDYKYSEKSPFLIN